MKRMAVSYALRGVRAVAFSPVLMRRATRDSSHGEPRAKFHVKRGARFFEASEVVAEFPTTRVVALPSKRLTEILFMFQEIRNVRFEPGEALPLCFLYEATEKVQLDGKRNQGDKANSGLISRWSPNSAAGRFRYSGHSRGSQPVPGSFRTVSNVERRV